MPKYIDADAFEKRIEEERTYLLNRGQTWAENILVKHLLDILYEQPIADVVEVVHGEWVDKGEDYMIRWTCSNCGRRDTHIYNFCPDCGADMRGGDAK